MANFSIHFTSVVCLLHVFFLWNDLQFEAWQCGASWPSQGGMKANRPSSGRGEGGNDVLMGWKPKDSLHVYISIALLIYSYKKCNLSLRGFWRNLHKCTYDLKVQSNNSVLQMAWHSILKEQHCNLDLFPPKNEMNIFSVKQCAEVTIIMLECWLEGW